MALATELHVTREALHAERRHRAEAEQQRHRIELELKVTILTLLHFVVLSVCLSLNYLGMCSISRISPSWERAGCKKTLCLLHYPCKIKFIHSFILVYPRLS